MAWYETSLNTEVEHKKAVSEFGTELKRKINKNFTESVKTKGCYFCQSWFFKKPNGNWVYISIGDTRTPGWHNKILIRKAKDQKDFQGGQNFFATLKTIGGLYERL